jgi:competence protein ComEC
VKNEKRIAHCYASHLGFVVAVFLFASAAYADYVEVRRNANVYLEPSTTSEVLRHIDVSDTTDDVVLSISAPALRNGYHSVHLPEIGRNGWIYKSRVRRFPGTHPNIAEPSQESIPLGTLTLSDDVMVAHFIDVGQGDATLLEFSCGAVLIDAGGEMTDTVNGSDNLITYLDNFFARRTDLNSTLDLVAISHAHIDHTRAVSAILARPFTIRSIIDNGFRHGNGGPQQETLQDHAANNVNVSYQAITEGGIELANGLTNETIDPIDCAGTDPVIRVLWGAVDNDPGWQSGAFDNGNNHSVVIRIDFGETSFLFTGDLEDVAIEDLVHAYSESDVLDVDVYQVGHHGSHNGTTQGLLQAMTPQLAVISMGNSELSNAPHSAYGYAHPRQDVVDLLTDESFGVSSYRHQPVAVPVGIKGACNNCSPKRPAEFRDINVSRAVYGTGWDGNVRLYADSSGNLVINTGH